ncbi:putative ferric reductase transmembrane component [Podospora australis]|uniref:Ferric reductase transmembrane component n=1 Tax=Podospora australis TaxID=1536484 RepID=A0AAN7AHR0_9PEZI|nr:putative ferric reductase transmembrane component [Podospora australis]
MGASHVSLLQPRHIQNFSEDSELEPHWGYAYRQVPCTNDPGSCAYLDVVYESHDRGMIYMGIFWLTIFGILLAWGLARRIFPAREPVDDLIAQLSQRQGEQPEPSKGSFLSRSWRALASSTRHYLLPNSVRAIFGHTTRLQVLILVVLTSYLTIWSFVGIVYGRWVTPIKGQPEHVVNTRTSLGPWADRVGVLAYALTPLSVLFASRESLLSMITGVPYTSFMFLHRWTGYIILAQSLLHTLGWVLVEGWLYQPQPKVWNGWVEQDYAIWGFVALTLLLMIWIFSFPWVIRNVTGYEFFRKAHYVLAMVYIGALIGHWEQLQCFLVPGIVLWVVDRLARYVRMGMLHFGYLRDTGRWGFAAAKAEAKFWKDEKHGDVVRLDWHHQQSPWKIGQHFFLCFTEGSIWQSHPFTPLSLPVSDEIGRVKHSYIFRAKGGETKKIAKVIAEKLAEQDKAVTPTTSVILQGAYGENTVEGLTQDINVLCVAGGTGITYVLPVLLRLVREKVNPNRKVELIWAVKRRQDMEWVGPELEELRRLGAAHNLVIRIFVTAEEDSESESESSLPGKESKTGNDAGSVQSVSSSGSSMRQTQRPDVAVSVNEFIGGVAQGSSRVFGSGPPSMIGELRSAVAQCNSGSKVFKGEERFDVRLVCDDRLEW